MKLPRFQVHRPTSVTGALALKAEFGDEAAFYVGGTELLLIMKLGLAEYPHLIDLKRVVGLGELTVSKNEIAVGAAVTHLSIETDPDLRRAFPALAGMVAGIGNVRVRNSGSIGGNLAFADPHSDPATFLTAVGGSADLVDSTGATRRVAVSDLTLAPYITVLQENEMITSIAIPVSGPEVTVVHRHLRFRERPAVTATALARSIDGEVVEVRVAVGSVCPVPIRLPDVEDLAVHRPTNFAAAVRDAVAAAIDTSEDLDGSPDYKRHLAGEMVVRCVSAATGGDEEQGMLGWN